MCCLIGKVLSDTLGDRNTTAFEFYHSERNSVYINDKIGAFCIIADNCYLFSNGKIVLCGILEIDKEDRFGRFAGFFGNFCPIFEKTVNLFVGIVQTVLEVASRAYKLVNSTAGKLIRIAALTC